jgi:hypothetical protein
MTRREKRILLVGAIVLAVVCALLFARAVLAQRASDYAHAQARAAILVSATAPSSDVADRTMLGWSGATGQVRYWQALQRFRLVAARATAATQVTVVPSFIGLSFNLEQTEAYLRQAALEAGTNATRSRLYDMLGLAYYDDAALHAGQVPVGPALDAKAISAFRLAVLVDGTNEAAKTNLELLLREQLSQQQPPPPATKPVPDTNRADNGPDGPTGLPSFFGAFGKKIRGGF